jgi:hypothetical protein
VDIFAAVAPECGSLSQGKHTQERRQLMARVANWNISSPFLLLWRRYRPIPATSLFVRFCCLPLHLSGAATTTTKTFRFCLVYTTMRAFLALFLLLTLLSSLAFAAVALRRLEPSLASLAPSEACPWPDFTCKSIRGCFGIPPR